MSRLFPRWLLAAAGMFAMSMPADVSAAPAPADLAARGLAELPSFAGYVVDGAELLSTADESQLTARLADLERRKGSQLVVLVVRSTAPEQIEQYGIRLARAWQPGRKGINDGAILIVAVDDRAVRLEVGRGLEGAIPDVYANRITDDIIVPRFRDGDFAGGIAAGVEATVRLIDGEPLPAPERQRRSGGAPWMLLLLVALVAGSVLRVLFGRLIGATVAGGVTGFAGWVITGALWAGLVAGIVGFLVALAGGLGGGMGGGMGGWGGALGGGRHWRSGGFGSGGFGGGGFGGGFGGGGGGSFGGGGASGRW